LHFFKISVCSLPCLSSAIQRINMFTISLRIKYRPRPMPTYAYHLVSATLLTHLTELLYTAIAPNFQLNDIFFSNKNLNYFAPKIWNNLPPKITVLLFTFLKAMFELILINQPFIFASCPPHQTTVCTWVYVSRRHR